MDSEASMPRTESASLVSLPNELLLELIEWESSSLYTQRKDDQHFESDCSNWPRESWLSWAGDPCTLYTRPWATAHHPIALPLSKTCRRLRELMLASVWVEVGLDSLEDLCKLRSGLRLFPERAGLISRLEWRWLETHPAQLDEAYRREKPEIARMPFFNEPLELLLEPPRRWPKQPLATEEECVEAMSEVICQLSSLATLLWVSPYFSISSQAVEFLAQKPFPLRSLQLDLGGLCKGLSLATVKSAYWKLAGRLERLAINSRSVFDEDTWYESDLTERAAFDGDLSHLDAFSERWVESVIEQRKAKGKRELTEERRSKLLAMATLNEREATIVYKTVLVACQGSSLRSLAVSPHWVFSLDQLVHHWVKLERFHVVCERQDSYLSWLKENAHIGKEALDENTKTRTSSLWSRRAQWHRGAAAIRPAMYHVARHRNVPGPLTAQDVQAIDEQGANYPASLFYPHFRNSVIAQRLLDEWEALVSRGEGERVVCQCAECK